MAKLISDEIMRLKMVINGDEAQAEVLQLERANKQLGVTLDGLNQRQKELSKSRKKDSIEYKENEIAIQKLTLAMRDNSSKITATVKSMDIMSLTSTQLNQRLRDLNFTMSHMNPNDKGYKAAQEEARRLNTRLGELRTGAQASSNSIGSLADKFNKYQGVALAVAATLTGVALSIQQTIDMNNKLADAQTTVSKTTGLTNDEVKELTKSYGEFDTRTSRMDLLKISEIGGRLGVPKEEIKDFTKEVDKAYVALGDGFAGGVEAVANKLGKIKGLFKETKDLNIAVAMNQIGSSLNELGASGAASEENIAEFALRVGSLPEGLKPTIAEALALGAAFEESGIDAERGGTAYANFVSIAAKNTKAFAEVMGKTQEEVKKLINTDPTEFFLQFSERAKGMKATDISKIFESLGISDQFVSKIVGSASEDVERFRRTIDLSNKSLIEATSLQEEFNKVNTNSAAIFDKVRKTFIGMFTSEAVANTLNFFIERFGRMIGVGAEANDGYRAFGQTILFLVKIFAIGSVSIFSYNAAIALTSLTMASAKAQLLSYTVIQKVNNFLNQTGAAIQNILTASYLRGQIAIAIVTRNTVMQTAAQERLNLVTRANPWGAILAIVVAVGLAYVAFSKQTDEVTAKQKVLNDLKTQAIKSTIEEKNNLQNLVAIAKDENGTKENKIKAIKAINAISPQYLGNITLENIKTAEGTKILGDYIRMLDKKAMAQALSSKRDELFKNQLDIQGQGINPFAGKAATFLEQKLNTGNLKRTMSLDEAKNLDFMTKTVDIEKELAKYVPSVRSAYKSRRDELKENFNAMAVLNAEQKKYLTTNPEAYLKDVDPLNIPGEKPEKVKAAKKTQGQKDAENELKAFQKSQEDLLKAGKDYDAQFLQQQSDYRLAKIELMSEGSEKELAKLEEELYRERLVINNNINTKERYDEVDKIIERSTGKLKIALQASRQKMRDEDAYWNGMELIAIETNENKKLALQEKNNLEQLKADLKAQNDSFAKLQENSKDLINQSTFQNDTVEKQKTFLAGLGYSKESLNEIRTWEEGRKEIEKYYQQKDLEDQVTFLQTKIAEFNVLMATMPLSFSPDQIAQIEAYRIKINELLAEITKLKNGGDPKGADFSSLSSFGGKTDILGLDPTQWEAMFTKTNDLTTNINKVGAAIQATQQLMGMYFQFVEANQKKELQEYERANDRKKRSLKTQLQTGYINQETYKKLTLKADAELEKKKTELAVKAAKRERAMQIASIISSTALAVVGALGNKPWTPFNFALAGVVGALGAVQLATVLAQPLPSAPGAEDGYYPVLREQDGKRFNARKRQSRTGMYDEPTMLVGEAGKNFPELVVAGNTLKRINPQIHQSYMQEISRVEGFENGLSPKQNSTASNDEMMIRMIDALNRNSEIMQEIRENGIVGVFDTGPRTGKSLKESVKSYEKLENNSKY